MSNTNTIACSPPREQFGEKALAAAWAEGRALPLEQAVAEAQAIAAHAGAS
jgi:hypothetical protein